MRTIIRNSIHNLTRSHECIVCEIGNVRNGGKKVKITYEAYNAVEKFNVEFFEGNKFNHIFSMLDMGELPNSSAYNVWDERKRKKRAEDLFNKAAAMCEKLLDI
jgi:hypothetical protein